jgi:hypothetical protein
MVIREADYLIDKPSHGRRRESQKQELGALSCAKPQVLNSFQGSNGAVGTNADFLCALREIRSKINNE